MLKEIRENNNGFCTSRHMHSNCCVFCDVPYKNGLKGTNENDKAGSGG